MQIRSENKYSLTQKMLDFSFFQLKSLRLVSIFTIASLFNSLCQLVSGILYIRFVTPNEIGTWHSFSLFSTYATFLLSGILNGMSRELPFALGKSDNDTAKQYLETALFYIIFCCSLCLLIGCIISLIAFKGTHQEQYTLIAVTIITSFRFYNDYLITTFRSNQSFINLGKVYIFDGLISMISLPLVYYFHYEGLIIRAITIAGVTLFLLHYFRPLPVLPQWHKSSFLVLLKTGVPIFAFSYLVSSTATFDKVMLLKTVGTTYVGYYALAGIVQRTFSMLPTSLASYIYPRMTYTYGQTNDPRILWKTAVKSAFIIFFSMIPMVFIAWYITPYIIESFFPQYTQGIFATQITMISTIFSGMVIGANALWSMKRWLHIALYQGSLSALQIICPWLGVSYLSDPLTGVAFGMLSAQSVSFFIALLLTYHATHKKI